MRDPYDILGVPKTASADEIRKAYRKLAKECHPDLHPGDEKAERRFKEISGAHGLLSDPDKRKRFDAGEIDAEGHERPEHAYYRTYADGGDGAKYARYGASGGYEDMSDIFRDLFGEGRGPGRGGEGLKMRGGDISYTLDVSFLDAARGTKRRATMADGKTLDISIPEGVRDRQTLRLKGKGMPGIGGGPPGDAYIEVHIQPHAFFTRKDMNVHMTLPISLREAVLGGKVKVPTVSGTVEMTVPKNANTGTTLRLKGRGILDPKSKQKGDQYVRLDVVLPDEPDADLTAFVENWAAGKKHDPRKGMEA
ncbi:MAG: J domain-containing protein [Rhodospirillales bacterium]|nr:J domain-containing protein [Rhodospirillales bacterium]MBO6786138.1 J domain-containing protein [Rhodospirillales bacterium]